SDRVSLLLEGAVDAIHLAGADFVLVTEGLPDYAPRHMEAQAILQAAFNAAGDVSAATMQQALTVWFGGVREALRNRARSVTQAVDKGGVGATLEQVADRLDNIRLGVMPGNWDDLVQPAIVTKLAGFGSYDPLVPLAAAMAVRLDLVRAGDRGLAVQLVATAIRQLERHRQLMGWVGTLAANLRALANDERNPNAVFTAPRIQSHNAPFARVWTAVEQGRACAEPKAYVAAQRLAALGGWTITGHATFWWTHNGTLNQHGVIGPSANPQATTASMSYMWPCSSCLTRSLSGA
ncbi:MAG TPA: hypothetical protein VEY93_09080, partial [Longimicrobium sp.]|nr:hypothetical protein [Longimicrobium sp.]